MRLIGIVDTCHVSGFIVPYENRVIKPSFPAAKKERVTEESAMAETPPSNRCEMRERSMLFFTEGSCLPTPVFCSVASERLSSPANSSSPNASPSLER